MTKNAYGTEVNISESYDFDGWLWEDYVPTDLIAAISKEAAKAVLYQIGQDAHLGIYSSENGCFIRMSLGGDMGNVSISLADLIDHWIDIEGPDEEARAPLIDALEDALTKVRGVD